MLTPVNGGVGAADAEDGRRKKAKADIKDIPDQTIFSCPAWGELQKMRSA
ncbi:hypothetical protein PbJCM17693_19660 [Paenibacillus macerans]|nr:hypothetical protein PbJCM17693_19660 [Paenibacillus macerans]